MDDEARDSRHRDVMTFRVLGVFFTIMGVLVLAATYETIGKPAAMIVSVSSGLVLVAVGSGMLYASRRLAKKTRDD